MDASKRITEFIRTVQHEKIVIIGHRAVFYTLEHLSTQRSFEDIVSAPWQWQAGWRYQIDL